MEDIRLAMLRCLVASISWQAADAKSRSGNSLKFSLRTALKSLPLEIDQESGAGFPTPGLPVIRNYGHRSNIM